MHTGVIPAIQPPPSIILITLLMSMQTPQAAHALKCLVSMRRLLLRGHKGTDEAEAHDEACWVFSHVMLLAQPASCYWLICLRSIKSQTSLFIPAGFGHQPSGGGRLGADPNTARITYSWFAKLHYIIKRRHGTTFTKLTLMNWQIHKIPTMEYL